MPSTSRERPFQHLEKRYFEVGNLGFPVFKAFGGNMGMCICNDRRWPETYRVMGLQNVEMVMLGYNTPLHNAPSPDHDEHSWFHNQLSMQAGAYQNGTWVVGVAKGGTEEGVPSLADSMIVAPSGKVVARAGGIDDELIVHRCDLDAGKSYKHTTFNFAIHRQPDAVPADRRAQGRGGTGMKNKAPDAGLATLHVRCGDESGTSWSRPVSKALICRSPIRPGSGRRRPSMPGSPAAPR